jgi:hypothetical protein
MPKGRQLNPWLQSTIEQKLEAARESLTSTKSLLSLSENIPSGENAASDLPIIDGKESKPAETLCDEDERGSLHISGLASHHKDSRVQVIKVRS